MLDVTATMVLLREFCSLCLSRFAGGTRILSRHPHPEPVSDHVRTFVTCMDCFARHQKNNGPSKRNGVVDSSDVRSLGMGSRDYCHPRKPVHNRHASCCLDICAPIYLSGRTVIEAPDIPEE